MTDFAPHDLETAPEASRPLLESSKAAFGRIPGLHGVMAEAPALLDGYKHLHRLFQEETSFDADEITVVWQTINVEHACHYCVPAHTGIARAMEWWHPRKWTPSSPRVSPSDRCWRSFWGSRRR